MTAPLRPVRVRPLVAAGLSVMLLASAACDTNAPDSPGDRLDVDGESPLITDPGGIGNQITNDEIERDDGLRD